ncbi:MAG: FAD-dependent oxidoreductase [Methylophilaceae bacterium]
MSKKVAIIGGGIIGCLTAIKLKESGFEVTIVDKNEIGKESSWAGAGILFPLMPWIYPSEVYDLCLNSAEFYKEFSKKLFKVTGIDPEFDRTGMMIIPPYDLIKINKWASKHQYKIEDVDFHKSTALLMPLVAQIRSPRLMKAIKKYLIHQGIKIIENIELCPIKNSAKLINEWPTKDNNLIKADYFIVTSGAWVSMIKPKYTNKIYPVRGQMIQYKASELKINHILYSDDFYILQRKDGVIIAGSTVEEVGFDDKITIESIDYLKKKSESLIPELKNIIVENHWSGFRPGSKNNIPIIRKDDEFENIFINSGHFRYGLTMAPKSAEIINNLLVNSQL